MDAIRADKIIISTNNVYNNAVLLVDNGHVKSVIDFDSFKAEYPSQHFVYKENSILCPTFINCHTHTELSADLKINEFDNFTDWIKQLIRYRQTQTFNEQFEAAKTAIKSAYNLGTIGFADISNTGMMIEFFENEQIDSYTFLEVLGFQSDKALSVWNNCNIKFKDILESANVVLSPHSPYGVSPELFRLLKHPSKLQSVHIDESIAERNLLKKGTGELKNFLSDINVWDSEWKTPNADPYHYIDQFGFLDNTLLVHCLNMNEPDITFVSGKSAKMVLCPRSNQFLHKKQPDYELLKNIEFALGTDSLASCPDLSIYNEMRFLYKNSNLDHKKVFKSATETGAAFMNFNRLGTLETGKRAICNYYRFPVLSSDPVQQLLTDQPEEHSVLKYD